MGDAVEQLWRVFGDVVPLVLVGVPIVVAMVAALAAYRRRTVDAAAAWRRSVLDGLVVAAALPVAYLVLVPGHAGDQAGVSLVPGADLFPLHDSMDVLQFAGNLLLLAPLAFLAPLRWPRLRHLPRMALAAAGFAITVEALQWLLDAGRIVSIDDALINTAGAVLGACLSLPWWRRQSQSWNSASPTVDGRQ